MWKWLGKKIGKPKVYFLTSLFFLVSFLTLNTIAQAENTKSHAYALGYIPGCENINPIILDLNKYDLTEDEILNRCSNSIGTKIDFRSSENKDIQSECVKTFTDSKILAKKSIEKLEKRCLTILNLNQLETECGYKPGTFVEEGQKRFNNKQSSGMGKCYVDAYDYAERVAKSDKQILPELKQSQATLEENSKNIEAAKKRAQEAVKTIVVASSNPQQPGTEQFAKIEPSGGPPASSTITVADKPTNSSAPSRNNVTAPPPPTALPPSAAVAAPSLYTGNSPSPAPRSSAGASSAFVPLPVAMSKLAAIQKEQKAAGDQAKKLKKTLSSIELETAKQEFDLKSYGIDNLLLAARMGEDATQIRNLIDKSMNRMQEIAKNYPSAQGLSASMAKAKNKIRESNFEKNHELDLSMAKNRIAPENQNEAPKELDSKKSLTETKSSLSEKADSGGLQNQQNSNASRSPAGKRVKSLRDQIRERLAADFSKSSSREGIPSMGGNLEENRLAFSEDASAESKPNASPLDQILSSAPGSLAAGSEDGQPPNFSGLDPASPADKEMLQKSYDPEMQANLSGVDSNLTLFERVRKKIRSQQL